MLRMPQKYHAWALLACCVTLTLLWLPGLRFPVVSDTAIYAELGENLWKHGTYSAMGMPSGRHPPLHALLSYPFVAFAGIHLGMKLATLLAGFGVLLASYWLLRRAFGRNIALGTVVVLTFHHAFVLMTMLGSADLLFAALFIGALAAYSSAEENKRWYAVAGLFAGLACVTRYNGFPLIPLFFFYTLVRRRQDLFRPRFIIGMALSVLPLAAWFARNYFVFSNPFHSEFNAELAGNSPGLATQFFSNVVFYIHPLHNVLPILFITALYGIIRHGRRQNFLLLGMASAWVLTAVWWVQAMRFAFPGYPILLGFGIAGLADLWSLFARSAARTRSAVIIGSIALVALSHLSLLCFYAYGQCNAWVDRHVSWIPPNLGLTPEGFYAWSLMRDELVKIAPQGSTVSVDNTINERAWQQGVFRPDMQVIEGRQAANCPVYHITQGPMEDELVITKTEAAPVTYLTIIACARE